MTSLKNLSRDLNYIAVVVMSPKICNSRISMRELQFYKDLTRKNTFFERWSWFKLTFSGFKSLHQCGKSLKLKVRKFWGLIPTFVEVTGENLVGLIVT